jgi:hypothetical protein
VGSPPFSAVTLPPIVPTNNSIKDQIIIASQKNYASPREKVELNINTWFEPIVKFVATNKPEAKKEIKKTESQTFSAKVSLPNKQPPLSADFPVKKDNPPPKTFSLDILKNKTKEPNKNKEELKAFLSEIIANKKVAKEPIQPPPSPVKSPIPAQKEIPQDVLEDLLRVKPDE